VENKGKIFHSSKYGNITVIDYRSSDEVYCVFEDTGYKTCATMGDIRKGCVKDRLVPTVYGVGYLSDSATRQGKTHLPQYVFWTGMLKRCYSASFVEKHPSYRGCSVSDNFKNYSYFKEWSENQIGFGNEGWQLDKDILVKGNKIYSEDTCCFVPPDINNAFCKANKTRGSCSIGVYFDKTSCKFVAQISLNGKLKKLGSFNSEKEAFLRYKIEKELHFKFLADSYKNMIDIRVYEALINYTVSVDD